MCNLRKLNRNAPGRPARTTASAIWNSAPPLRRRQLLPSNTRYPRAFAELEPLRAAPDFACPDGCDRFPSRGPGGLSRSLRATEGLDPMSQLLAEPPTTARAAPVAEAQRVRLLDALRGVALLGILLMNIPGFAMPNYFSEAFRNDPTSANFWLNAVITVFFEGKMRALFGMVFGAG